jgi:hypothetical protein
VYTLAGVAKVWRTGLDWMTAANLPLLSAERSVGALAPLADARMWAATHPWLGQAGGLTVLLVELAGAAFLWPRARRAYAAVMILCHVCIGIFLVTHEDEVRTDVLRRQVLQPLPAEYIGTQSAEDARPRDEVGVDGAGDEHAADGHQRAPAIARPTRR